MLAEHYERIEIFDFGLLRSPLRLLPTAMVAVNCK